MLDLDRPVLLVLNVRLLVRPVLVRDPFLLALEFVLGGKRDSRARDLPPPPGRALEAGLEPPADVHVVGDERGVGLWDVADVPGLAAGDTD
eukprot:821072-Prymnesium_polylepis.1